MLTSGLFVFMLVLPATAIAAALGAYAMAWSRWLIDRPGPRSSHAIPTPRGGGVGLVVAFLAAFLVTRGWGDVPGLAGPELTAVVLGGTVVALAGLADDVRPWPTAAKFAAQFAAAGIVLASGLAVEAVWIPGIGRVALGPLAWPLTLLWLVGLTNAFNFMDGLDGLAGATGAVAAAFLAAAAAIATDAPVAIAAAILSAACLGFLVPNAPPARVFMGDVGSQFAGFVFAALGVLLARGEGADATAWIVPLLLAHFLLDTAFTAARRWRRGENVLAAHRSHLYQLLHRTGLGHGRVTLIQAGLAAAQGVCVLWLTRDGAIAAVAAVVVLQLAYAAAVLRRAARAGVS